MKQIIVRKMTLSDWICNQFYKVRFWSYRKIFKWKLKNHSSEEKKNLELMFIDDFDEVSWGNKPDDKWIIGEGWGAFRPNKPIHYFGGPELIEGKSLAKFVVKYEPKTFPDDYRTDNPITIPFMNSKIATTKSFRQQYGQYELRCTIPYDKGVWPAWWVWGATWPPEIDIFEMYGKKDGKTTGIQEINLHYGKTEDDTKESSGSWKVKIDTKKNKDAFHEFTLKWTPDKIECITDGIKIYRYTRKEILDKWYNVLPDANMKLILNHGLDKRYVNESDTDFYSEYLVDYVRVYKIK